MATLARDSNLCAIIMPVALVLPRNRSAVKGAFHLSPAKPWTSISLDAFVADYAACCAYAIAQKGFVIAQGGSEVTAGGLESRLECVTIADPNCRPNYFPSRCHLEGAAR
jgi:hypothetical protein